MSHDLMLDDNHTACMMYVDAPPWHSLGKRLEKPPTAKEAIRCANLDWTVIKTPVFYLESPARTGIVPDTYAVIPTDHWPKRERPVFGIVTGRYEVLQNRDAFAFFDPLVKAGQAVYETAGALGHGERIWVLARLPGSMDIGRGDEVAKYLLLANRHDGQGSVQVKITPVRVVCQNTLSLALSGGTAIQVPHHEDLHRKLAQIQGLIAWQQAIYADLETVFRNMTRVPLGPPRLQAYLAAVFPTPKKPQNPTPARVRAYEEACRRAGQARRGCARIFEWDSDTRTLGTAGTLWTGYNSVTEYVDHAVPARGGAMANPIRKLSSMWFGQGCTLKARAFRCAVDLMQPQTRTRARRMTWNRGIGGARIESVYGGPIS